MTEDEATAFWMEAHDRDPQVARFGILAGGSFVLDSVRLFAWFNSVEELADFLANKLPASYRNDDDYQASFAAEVRPMLAALNSSLDFESVRAAYNRKIADYAVIDWMGTFEDLASGDTDFAKELRESFSEDESPKPISDDDLEDFAVYLNEYM